MKDFKLSKKLICSFISAAMLCASSLPAAFAIGDDVQTIDTNTDTTLIEATATPSPTEEPEATATPSQQETKIRLNATVYSTSNKNEYNVVFMSGSTLPEITGFKFTADFDSNATIESIDFGESFSENGFVSKSITDDHAVTFIWKDGESSVSGSVVLTNAVVTSASKITSSNLSVSDFTATLADGTEIIINADLNVVTGTNLPNLSETEQKVYDALMTLPNTDSLTFYRNQNTGELYNISSYYCEPINKAIDSYEQLNTSSRTKVNTALSVNGTTYTSFTILQRAANAMNEISSIMQMTEAYKGIENKSDAINYEYLKTTFESISKEQPSALKRATKAYEEFNTALSEMETYNSYIENALESISEMSSENYNTKIASLKVQLTSANKFTSHNLYSTYISSIKKNAEALYEDIDKNYSGTYKEYMLASIDEVIDSVENGNIVLKYLPTFEINNGINIGNSFNVTVSRNNTLKTQEAVAYIAIYSEEGELIQTSHEKEFNIGNTAVDILVYPSANDYSVGTPVILKCFYKYNGVTYDLGELKVSVYKNVNLNSTTNSGGGFSTGASSNNNNSGTVYPTAVPDNKPIPTKAPNYANENPYTDLDGYDWALDSIIGLTNAGIVNGMGDNEFNPSGNVTREQFCKMVVQMFGINAADPSSEFVDVDESKWYAPYVNAAVSAGFVQGQSDEYFGIGESIMRQDMATILYRALGKTGDGVVLEFTDNSIIADYANEAVAELVGLEIMNGYEDGSFKPRGSATRAEASKVVWGAYNLIK